MQATFNNYYSAIIRRHIERLHWHSSEMPGFKIGSSRITLWMNRSAPVSDSYRPERFRMQNRRLENVVFCKLSRMKMIHWLLHRSQSDVSMFPRKYSQQATASRSTTCGYAFFRLSLVQVSLSNSSNRGSVQAPLSEPDGCRFRCRTFGVPSLFRPISAHA